MRNKNLISIVDACERYDKQEGGFYASAFLQKKNTGLYPDWYVFDNMGNIFIDTYHYEKYAKLERKAWLYATDDLYYLLAYDFGCTDTSIARFMARHSKKFTNEASWSSFISKTLFSLPQDSILQKRLTMTVEFMVTATYMLKIILQEERNNENNVLPIRSK